jgi:hypothetical protein
MQDPKPMHSLSVDKADIKHYTKRMHAFFVTVWNNSSSLIYLPI